MLLRFMNINAPPGSKTPYYGNLWISDNWFPNLPLVKELKNKHEFTMTWTDNGGDPPEIGLGRSLNINWSFLKGFTIKYKHHFIGINGNWQGGHNGK